jgi:hypothetical protein
MVSTWTGPQWCHFVHLVSHSFAKTMSAAILTITVDRLFKRYSLRWRGYLQYLHSSPYLLLDLNLLPRILSKSRRVLSFRGFSTCLPAPTGVPKRYPQTGLCQISSRHQPVVPPADDEAVVASMFGHRKLLLWWSFCSSPPLGLYRLPAGFPSGGSPPESRPLGDR